MEHNDAVELVSLRSIWTQLKISNHGANAMAGAGLLGQSYVLKSEDDSRAQPLFFEASYIDELAGRPHVSKADVQALAADTGAEIVLVIRQSGPQTEDPALWGRTWFGFDARKAYSSDPNEVREQDEATRRLWKISAVNRARLDSMERHGGFGLLIATVGGLVVWTREITGLDPEVNAADPARHGFIVRKAGSWQEKLRGNWLRTGKGPSVLTWLPDRS